MRYPFGMRAAAEPMMKRYYVRASIDAARDLWGTVGVDDVRARMAPPRPTSSSRTGCPSGSRSAR
jgi:hypothetical protein